MTLVTLNEIRAAADRIASRVLASPLVPIAVPTDLGEPRSLLVKPENLQAIGAFKIRGALNAVATLDPQARRAGVVTHSSGNHAQAVALAARLYQTRVTIVMPDVSPKIKVEATRALGADVVLVPAADRLSQTEELVADHGYAFVPPYDDAAVIAGQGTVGTEIVEQLGSPDDELTVLVPVGGGGLISGVAAAVKALRPDATVIGVEPELAADLADGFARGRRVSWPLEHTYRTSADGVRSAEVGDLPWEHIRAYVDDVLTVGEDAIRQAVRLLATRGRLVAEPSGAVATAAYLAHGDAFTPGTVVAILSGGNIEPAMLASILGEVGTPP